MMSNRTPTASLRKVISLALLLLVEMYFFEITD